MLKNKYSKPLVSFLVALLCLISVNLNVFASSGSLTFSIRDFSFTWVNVPIASGSSGGDYTSSVVFGNYTRFNRQWTYFKNSNTSAYEQGSIKNVFGVHLVNTQIDHTYNLTFDYAPFAAIKYTLMIAIAKDNVENTLDYVVFTDDKSSINASNSEIYTCNVNFKLTDLGFYSSDGIGVYIILMVPQNFEYNWSFYFSDFVLSDLDDLGSFTPPDSDFSQSTSDMGDLGTEMAEIEELYKINTDELDALMHTDMSEFDNGLTAVKMVVEDVLNASSMLSVLTFVLAWGLGIYIIGRRLA